MIETKEVIAECIQVDKELFKLFNRLHDLIGNPEVFMMNGSVRAQYAMHDIMRAKKNLEVAMTIFAGEIRESEVQEDA